MSLLSQRAYAPIQESERPSIFGWEVLQRLDRDAIMLLWCKIISFGFLAVVLAVYLVELGFSASDVGLLFSLTLVGDAVISIILTSHADKWGRKFTLLLGSVFAVITSIVFTTQTNFWVLLVAGIVGVISPSGYEVGPFMAIELSALAQVTLASDRTKLMGWYNLVGCFASAIGALLCGGIVSYCHFGPLQLSLLLSYRVSMGLYAICQIILCILFSQLSNACEIPAISATVKNTNPVSLFLGLHRSKGIVLKISMLFIIDSFAGSFILLSMISNWFYVVYNTEPHILGTMIFICNIVAGISALFATSLAHHIGLIMTMAVTHLPSNLFILLVPLMPNEPLSIAMLCLRYCISQMDVPTRNAYVQSVVDDDERSAANGVTNVVRSVGASAGPFIAGMLYNNPKYINYPFYIAGSLKICYDLLLVYNFSSVATPDEISRSQKLMAERECERKNNNA